MFVQPWPTKFNLIKLSRPWFDLNPNFLNKLPPEDDVRGEQRMLGQIKTKFRKTYLILFKI